ncbi:hypothetical protein K9L67_02660 [Candidatus Woesearchaeota archaeon]|nr:hypothetical protein [Candidatus Woesearchaeota archaeon]MCF7901105.1 hypothetical protein [Candidatus Woesearchaeota archaeon]MCF8013438.1 hypothetical protein [Candidatus Woesearchaeota archaeon]
MCSSVYTVSATLDGSIVTNSTPIPSGATFVVTWDCGQQSAGDAFSTELSFDYYNAKTTLTKPHQGQASGTWK